METDRKAKKRLILLLAVVLGIAGIVGGVFGYRRLQVRRELQGWKLEGIAATHAGNHLHAVEMLTRYLHVRPDDIEALRAYDESRQASAASDDTQAIADMIAVLRSLAQLTPLRENEHRQLMSLYSRAGNDASAAREADLVLAAHPTDAEALRFKTYALLRQRDLAPATQAARQWSQAAPDDLNAYSVEMAALQQSGSSPRDIISHVATLRRAHANDARFELLESMALRVTQQKAEPPELAGPGESPETRSAADWARQAAAHAPAIAPYTHELVDQLNRLALFDDSLGVLQKAAAAGDADSRRALARRFWESNQSEALVQLLGDESKAVGKADSELLYLYGVALARLGRNAETVPIQAELASRTKDASARAWLSLLKRFAGAGEGDPHQQVECFEYALARDSGSPYLHFFYAEALERIGEIDLAIQSLENATRLSATWAAPPSHLAELLMSRGRIDSALRAADLARVRAVHDGQIRDLSVAVNLARVWMAALATGRSADEAGLTQLIDAVQKASPEESETTALQVALLIRHKDQAGAAKKLADALRGPKPLSESALLRYASLSQSAHLGLEGQCFDRCQHDHGITADLASARATAILATQGKAKGLEAFDAAYAARRDPESASLQLIWQVARTHYLDAAGDPAAKAAWIALGDGHPEMLTIQTMVLAAPTARLDRQLTDRTIERVRKLTGEGGLQWRLARARWLLEPPGATRKEIEDATRILGAIVRGCPQCAEARLVLASSLERLQQPDGAIEQLKAAVALIPDSLEVTLQLVGFMEQRGNFAAAEQLLRRFSEGPLANPNALTALGWVQERQGNLDGAEQSYRHALTLVPDFASAQNNLALVLVKKGSADQLKEALTLAQQAAKAYPDSASILDTLAAAQAGGGDYGGALTSMERAIALDASNQSFKLHHIELLLKAGRTAGAREALGRLESTLAASSPDKGWDFDQRLRKLREALMPPTTSATSAARAAQ